MAAGARAIGRPFKPGQSGNPRGRPKGSRHKLSERFFAELCEDWEENPRPGEGPCRAISGSWHRSCRRSESRSPIPLRNSLTTSSSSLRPGRSAPEMIP